MRLCLIKRLHERTPKLSQVKMVIYCIASQAKKTLKACRKHHFPRLFHRLNFHIQTAPPPSPKPQSPGTFRSHSPGDGFDLLHQLRRGVSRELSPLLLELQRIRPQVPILGVAEALRPPVALYLVTICFCLCLVVCWVIFR